MKPDGRILERNVGALVRHAYVPVRPAPHFRRRLGAEFLRAWESERVRWSRRQSALRRPAFGLGFGIAAAAAALLLAIFLGDDLFDPSPASPAPLGELLARGDIAVRHGAALPFEVGAAAMPLTDGYLEVVTPDARSARLERSGEGAIVAAENSHLIGTGVQATRVELARGGLALDKQSASDAGEPWTLTSVAGALEVHHGELTAELLGRELHVRLGAGVAYALTAQGPSPLPLGESLLRGGELVTSTVLAQAETERGERQVIEAVPTVDAADEVATAGPGASDRATLVGRVLDADGQPVQDFTVDLLVEQDYANITDPVSRDFATPDGSFEWTGVKPGRYDVFVRAPGWATWRTPERVELVANESRTLAVQVEGGGSVRGFVVDRVTGAPIANAWVVSESDAPTMALPLSPDLIDGLDASVMTGADGSFELQRLSSGRQLLRVSHPEFAPQWSGLFDLPEGEEVFDLLFELGPEARVHGRVLRDDGSPWGGVNLVCAVVDWEESHRCMSFVHMQADSAGHYTAGGLGSGFSVVVLIGDDLETPSPEPPQVKPVPLAAGESQEVNFGTDIAGTRLVGVVRDARGTAMANLPLSIGPTDGVSPFDGWLAGSTDGQGRYAFQALEPGPYEIFASQGMAASVTFIGAVEVPDWPEIERDLVLGSATVRGRVTDAEQGRPEFYAVLIIEELATPGDLTSERHFVSKSMTDEDGLYSIEYLKPGDYLLSAYPTMSALAPAELVEFEVTAETTELRHDLVLPAGGLPTLRVTDPTGQPLSGAHVEVRHVESGVDLFWAPDKRTVEGRLGLPPLPPEPVRLLVTLEGYEPADVIREVKLGESEILVVLQPIE